jgi:V/A-type H+-transporting ATPase subunit C
MVNDLDYLAARLHGRRSRLAEAERLDGFCRLRDFPELGRAVYPEAEFPAAADFQRRLAQDLVRELSGLLKHLEGAGAELVSWMLVRFQVENIKVLLRGFLRRTPLEAPEEYLLSLPHGLALDRQALMGAGSLEEFAERLPLGSPRKCLTAALNIYRDQPRLLFLEGALDRGYFQELLARTERLSGEDRELIQPIMRQEADAFHLILVVRGKFHYGLTPELLLPLHVSRSGIPSERFSAMLAVSDIRAAASLAVGRAIDALPTECGSAEASATVDPSVLETLAWKRFLRLSNRAFRCSHMGLGAVVGYVGIRRVEVANLITVSEGVAMGAKADALRARLLPRTDLESVYV